MPSARTVFQVALTTMATMYVLNLIASQAPRARGLIKGNNLLAV